MAKRNDGAAKENLMYDSGDRPESYEFVWPGKRAAAAEAEKKTTKRLRPVKEKSVRWDSTENLFIEGDSLEALKLLSEEYSGAVRMIYIDPPYNTGGDFIYDDEREHADWCSMMYARLKLALRLLSDDGVIFISIDDNEQANLRKICDEVFGERNFIAQCVRKRRGSQANLKKNISPIHEYLVIYAKKNGELLHRVSANINESDYRNPDGDARGPYKTMPCTNRGGAVYTIETPTGKRITEEWRFKEETYLGLLADNRIVFPRGGEGKPRYKIFLSEKLKEGQLANTWLEDLPSNQEATKELKAIFGERVIFDMPKPLGLLKFCLELASDKDSTVLDFFAGSCTTAHAVMRQNAKDGGRRRFIMVQLPEPCREKSEAYRQGFETISEIGMERIRRAGRMLEEAGAVCDTGFKVFRVEDI